MRSLRRSSPGTPFDGEVARGYVKTQLDFGARVPGTEAARKTGDWIVAPDAPARRHRDRAAVESRDGEGRHAAAAEHLRALSPAGDHADSVRDALGFASGRRIRRRIRPSASLPVPGANDGASGVGLFIALGDVLKKTPPTVGVDLLFVDGEDYGTFGPPDVDVLARLDVFRGEPAGRAISRSSACCST